MSWKRNKFLIIGLLLSLPAAGQFQHTCMIDSIKEAGFYSIPISPELSAYIKTDLSDLRITDEKGQWIPHIINWLYSHSTNDPVNFEMPILKKENTNSQTILIIRNNSGNKLSNLFLNVKNATINRFASLSGSDDQVNWYTITDSLLLKDQAISDDKTFLKIFFPPVNYNYYRIIISNGKKDPLNIQEVINEGSALPEKAERFIVNPESAFSQIDSTGYSLIKIENVNNFHVSKLTIHISSPKFFERKAGLFTSYAGSIHEMLKRTSNTDFAISSNSSGEYTIPIINNRVFYLLVENKDNPPLQVAGITTEQDKKEIIAWLDEGKNYRLLFDDSLAHAPDYDLQQFSGKIPKSVATLNVGKIEVINERKINLTSKKNHKWWIWPIIVVVILLLGYSTLTLTRDVNKQNKQADTL